MNIKNLMERLEKIDEEKNKLEQAIFEINLKLEEVRVNQQTLSIMPNISWLYRTKHALGIKKLQLKKLNMDRDRIRKTISYTEKENERITKDERCKRFERIFIKIAEEVLTIEEYYKIKTLSIAKIEKEVEESEASNKETRSNKNGDIKDNKKRALWTTEDIHYLEDNYKNYSIEELSDALGRSENSIRSKIQVIKKSNRR